LFIYKLSPFNKEYFIEVGLFLFCFFWYRFSSLPDLVKLAIFLALLSTLYLTIVLGKNERAKIKNLLTQKRKKKKVRFEVDQVDQEV